jgi:integrase
MILPKRGAARIISTAHHGSMTEQRYRAVLEVRAGVPVTEVAVRFGVSRQSVHAAPTAAGLSGFHFHDLRHTGNVLAGEAGATLRELMDRMGHASTRAALIYQHRTTQGDKVIADEISKRAEAELTGTQRARREGKHS